MSTILSNSDWDTMGAVQSAEVRVYPVGDYGNKAPNPSFEQDMTFVNAEVSQGWRVFNGSTSVWSITQDTSEHRTGAKSIKMDSMADGTGSLALRLANRIHPAEYGETWCAEIYIKGTGTAFIRAMSWNGFATTTLQTTTAAADGNWTKITATGAIPSGGIATSFDFGMLDDGIAYFDDVSFGRVPNDADVQVWISRDGGKTFTEAT